MTEVNTSKQEFEAAIATLTVYGFSKVLIKRTLKDILRVYNGNGGWPLIKENGYEVVIERLISDDGPKQCKESKSATQKLVDVQCTQHAEMCNMVSQQVSKPSILKTQKLVDVSHIQQHAETCNTATWCLQQESNSEKVKAQKLAEEVLKAQESVDVPHTQHDSIHATSHPTGIKQRKGTTRKGLRKRKQVSQEFGEKTCKPVSAAQTKQPRTESTTHRAINLQSTFEAAERLDIARMSAFKLTRRRDGGPNPMFSRLQKLKQAGAGASVSQNNNQQESSLFNSSQCGKAPSDSLIETMLSQRSQQSSDLPRGRWDPSDRTPAQESPNLPPGFKEPSVSSPESPRQPPGFWKPCCENLGLYYASSKIQTMRDE